MQLAGQLPKVAEVTFRKVHLHAGRVLFFSQVPEPVQVPEGSGAVSRWCGSGTFQCSAQVRFRQVPMRFPGEVLEGSGGSWRFRCGSAIKYWKIPIQCMHSVA